MGIYVILCGILFYFMLKPQPTETEKQTIRADVSKAFVNKDSPSTQGANSSV